MKKSQGDFDLDEIIPVKKEDENRIEVEATDFKLIDLLWDAGLLFLITGSLIFLTSSNRAVEPMSIAMIFGGILSMLLFKRKQLPSLIFIKGSREIRFRLGTLETAIDLDEYPFRVHTKTGGKGPRIRAIWIDGRYGNKKGAQIWCKGFHPLEKTVAVAAYLYAFIHGTEDSYGEYISEIKVS